MGVTRRCTRCHEVKPLDDFYPNGKKGRHSRCKPCANQATIESRQRHDPLRVRGRESDVRRKAKKTPRQIKDSNLRRTYGITVEQFEEMEQAQGGLCAACGRPPRGRGKNLVLHVDHCHETGRVRGLLCSKCNLAMGNADDDPALLRALADYLEREYAWV
jgi:Autographiviridae endonuclease VII